jgi:CheY-like chemotaxis protein
VNVATAAVLAVLGVALVAACIPRMRRRRIAARSAALETRDAATRARSDFLARLSRDIRTPMTGIIGMTELALATNLRPTQREYLETVRDCADSLLVVLKSVMDLATIDAGVLRLERVDFSLRKVIAEMVEPLAGRARQKGLALQTYVRPDVPDALNGDGTRLRQILANLIDTAIESTEEDDVALRVSLAPDSLNRYDIRFEVAGMRPSVASEARTTVSFALASRLAEMMRGRLSLEQVPAGGPQLRCTVRFAPATAAIAPPAPAAHRDPGAVPAPGRPLRVLLAEDNSVNQKLAIHLLEAAGHNVRSACDGVQAVEVYRHEPFDLICLDLHMPLKGGLEAAAEIRQIDRARGGRVAIIALTADALQGDRERCLAAGMDGYVTKPVRRDELQSEIKRVLQRPAEAV